jgi:hypothetical protein
MVYGPGDPYAGCSRCSRCRAAAPGHRIDRARAGWHSTRGFVGDVAEAIALAATDPRAAGR